MDYVKRNDHEVVKKAMEIVRSFPGVSPGKLAKMVDRSSTTSLLNLLGDAIRVTGSGKRTSAVFATDSDFVKRNPHMCHRYGAGERVAPEPAPVVPPAPAAPTVAAAAVDTPAPVASVAKPHPLFVAFPAPDFGPLVEEAVKAMGDAFAVALRGRIQVALKRVLEEELAAGVEAAVKGLDRPVPPVATLHAAVAPVAQEAAPSAKLKIGVVGIHRRQVEYIAGAFPGLDLRILAHDDNPNEVRRFANCDEVYLLIDNANHKFTDQLKAHGIAYTVVQGGVTRIRELLEGLAK